MFEGVNERQVGVEEKFGYFGSSRHDKTCIPSPKRLIILEKVCSRMAVEAKSIFLLWKIAYRSVCRRSLVPANRTTQPKLTFSDVLYMLINIPCQSLMKLGESLKFQFTLILQR